MACRLKNVLPSATHIDNQASAASPPHLPCRQHSHAASLSSLPSPSASHSTPTSNHRCSKPSPVNPGILTEVSRGVQENSMDNQASTASPPPHHGGSRSYAASLTSLPSPMAEHCSPTTSHGGSKPSPVTLASLTEGSSPF